MNPLALGEAYRSFFALGEDTGENEVLHNKGLKPLVETLAWSLAEHVVLTLSVILPARSPALGEGEPRPHRNFACFVIALDEPDRSRIPLALETSIPCGMPRGQTRAR